MKRFINSRTTLVSDAIDGFLFSAPNSALARLDGYPHTKVVVRTDWDKSRVALVSGGGSGHEPAHAGFVGEGMLTAAVCGEVFASPSVDAVLAGILAVTGDAGCLLIVKNYTGDRLNFGLAAERAKAMGRRVEMVIVADDVAIPGAIQPRGVAGTLFVHKIAGDLAARGAPLGEVAAAARDVARDCLSIGLALETCTVPGNAKSEALGADLAEMGLGIHGEPGVSKIALADADALMTQVCAALEQAIPAKGARYGALLNNLGAVPALEMNILANAFANATLAASVDLLVGPAPMMTSLDMNGFSVSLVALDAQRVRALLRPVDLAAWPGVRKTGAVRTVAMPEGIAQTRYIASEDSAIKAVLERICATLIASESDLNALDARVGDGDTGSTFSNGARSIQAALDELPLADGGQLCAALADRLTQNMGGSSGVLLAIALVAAGEALAADTSWSKAALAGVARMQAYGGASPGDRTMLDALVPALNALDSGASVAGAAGAARTGANATALMEKAAAGRSSYVSAPDLAGVVDPGAEAIARIFEGLAT